MPTIPKHRQEGLPFPLLITHFPFLRNRFAFCSQAAKDHEKERLFLSQQQRFSVTGNAAIQLGALAV